MVAQFPGLLVALCSRLERCLLLKDHALELPGTRAAAIVLEALTATFLGEVVLSSTYVDVGQQQPGALELLGIVWVVSCLLCAHSAPISKGYN